MPRTQNAQRNEPWDNYLCSQIRGYIRGPRPTGGAYSQVYSTVLARRQYPVLLVLTSPSRPRRCQPGAVYLRNEIAPLSSVQPLTAVACNSAPVVDNRQSLRKFESHYHQVVPDAPYMCSGASGFSRAPLSSEPDTMHLTSIQRASKHEPFCIDATFSPLVLPDSVVFASWNGVPELLILAGLCCPLKSSRRLGTCMYLHWSMPCCEYLY